MPTYEYVCLGCGHEFEEFQQMVDAPLVQCPKCFHDTLARKIGKGAGIIFKGSGFYQTDYKGKPDGPPPAKPSEGVKGDGVHLGDAD